MTDFASSIAQVFSKAILLEDKKKKSHKKKKHAALAQSETDKNEKPVQPEPPTDSPISQDISVDSSGDDIADKPKKMKDEISQKLENKHKKK